VHHWETGQGPENRVERRAEMVRPTQSLATKKDKEEADLKIKGQRIILRRDDPRDSDHDNLFRWLNMEEWKYYDQPDQPFQPISREGFDKQMKKQSDHPSSSSKGWWIDTVEGQLIGSINYYNWDQEEGSASIGICIPEEENWGKGYGTEALRLFLDFLFDSLGLDTVRTATWTGNKRMVRCAQKAGFTNHVTMPHRSSVSVRGESLERIEFSLSRAEWHEANRDGG
jgi:RimJ/RimL family protein N-acetyltransferase